jgi:hypothetical protein
LTDAVAIDAKRILLRYGAPIAVLDKVSQAHRIEFAREIAKTTLPDRESRLRELLAERGYMAPAPLKSKNKKKKAQSPPAAAPEPAAAAKPPAAAKVKPAAARPKAAVGKSKAKRA